MCGLLPTVVLLLSISEIGQSNFHNNQKHHHALISSETLLVHSELRRQYDDLGRMLCSRVRCEPFSGRNSFSDKLLNCCHFLRRNGQSQQKRQFFGDPIGKSLRFSVCYLLPSACLPPLYPFKTWRNFLEVKFHEKCQTRSRPRVWLKFLAEFKLGGRYIYFFNSENNMFQ